MLSSKALILVVISLASAASAQTFEVQQVIDEAVAKLKVLQARHTRAGELDEALAIRAEIRRVQGVLPDPGVLHVTDDDIGKVMHFEVTGASSGEVWGTEVFTGDSHLGTACVHAGLLKPGQRGLVRVRVIAGQREYFASTRNGVPSKPYGPWSVSFTVE